MEKYFNSASIITGVIGGFICKHLGGFDMLLGVIITLVVLDYMTGILKAIYNKQLSSEVGYKGIIKKVFIFIVIATSYEIQKVTGDSIPLREMTLVFFISNEAISLLENASEFIPIPPQLKNVLIQLRDKEQ